MDTNNIQRVLQLSSLSKEQLIDKTIAFIELAESGDNAIAELEKENKALKDEIEILEAQKSKLQDLVQKMGGDIHDY